MTSGLRQLRKKLRDAADALEGDGRPLKERLRSAHLYGLSGLNKEDFPDQEGRSEFESICQALTATGQMIEEAGSVSTTLFLLSDQEADDLARRISALADRYGAR